MEILKLNITIMKYLFLWPVSWLSERTYRIAGYLYLLLNCAIGGFAVSWAVIRQPFHNFENMNVINESLAAIGDFYGHFFMYYCFDSNLKILQKLVQDVNGFEKFSGLEVIAKTEAMLNKYTKLAFIYFTSAVCVNIAIPTLDMEGCDRRQPSDEYRKHDPCGLPLRNWYPFDASGPVIYPIIFILYSYSCISIPLRGLAMSMVLIGLLVHVLAQIRQCRKAIAEIFETEDVNEMDRRLGFCVNHHIAIIEFYTRLNSAFSTMMVLHISLTSFVISIICYQIVIIESYYDKVRHFMHMCGWIVLLFTACFFGQHLIDESESLADAIYDTKWYSAPARLQRNIPLVSLRSQKPLTLTAASLGVMSFPTFLSVMKAAYSYMTLIFTILQDEEE